MFILRKLLFPFAILYGFITSIRNFLYDKGILKSFTFDVPVIAVGNLSVGGTGKTPQIEYLIRLLSDKYKVATLSRGYKRKSEGFIVADDNATSEILGDEPYQFFQKFPDIQVAVDANRKNGIKQLLSQSHKPEIILLDDAFQHRKVKAGFYIMLSSFDDLFYHDCMLPTGNLRESRNGATRADMIIITKCPKDISEIAQQNCIEKVSRFTKKEVPVFFTYIDYDDYLYSNDNQIKATESKDVNNLIVAGIAKPEPFFAYLQAGQKNRLTFPDHHNFTDKDIELIIEKAGNNKIITTEKDYVRLKGKLPTEQLYYLPIKSSFVKNKEVFDNKILEYVGTSTRNR